MINMPTRAQDDSIPAVGAILSDGQFVYGAPARAFDVYAYLTANAPHLLPYADVLLDRAVTYSINPRVLLTLIELASGLVTNPNADRANPFALTDGQSFNGIDPIFTAGAITPPDFVAQIDGISTSMIAAFYADLYGTERTFQRDAPTGAPFPADAPNAATLAVIAAFAPIRDAAGIRVLVDPAALDGFYATYRRLFPDSDPLDASNRIYRPGDADYQALPSFPMQFPVTVGESWYFNGVHHNLGTTGTDMSAIDLSPTSPFPSWGFDNSATWVTAAAAGDPTRVNNCKVYLTHADGWETHYFHLEQVPTFPAGNIAANAQIGKVANTQSEALCVQPSSSSAPHVHFAIRRNGAFQPINGANLGGWTVHSGISPYDSTCSRMWLERANTKRCAFTQSIQNQGIVQADVARGKPVTASTSALPAANATDGNLGTRWASVEGVDPQWIAVDLGAVYPVAQVVLRWETAFAESLRIDVSDDNVTWTTAATYAARNGGVETLTVQKNGRYVRVEGLTRGHSGFGYSLYELEVYTYNAYPIPPESVRQPEPVPDSATLFFDNFNAGVPNAAWSSLGGTWTAVAGALQLSDACGTAGGVGLLVGDAAWGDYEVQFDLRGIAGSGKGILLRYADATANYNLVLRSLENDLHLYTPGYGDSASAYPVNNGRWYRVGVRADGDEIGVYIDGVLVHQRTDAGTPRRTGGVALWLDAGTVNCPFTVQYDNVIVRDLGTNAVQNGGFSGGMTNWGTWDAITYQIAGGVFEFYRNLGGASAIILQDTGVSVGALVARAGGMVPTGGVTLEALIDIGNRSGVRKRTTVLLHDADFSDLQVCTFWLPPNTPLRTYRMLTTATETWTSAVISIYASNADGVGWTQIDNVHVRARPDIAAGGTRCVDPGAP
ncbi:MAG: discoidin domain-containing protein, partial [Chloroflexota bacterium]|nr:discoidin domain-containing protein [Chloroflexota bacterium]